MNGYRYYVILHTISYENGDVTVDMINCDYNNWFNEIFMLFRDNTNLYLFISNMPYIRSIIFIVKENIHLTSVKEYHIQECLCVKSLFHGTILIATK
jgi:hypothetical protein